MNVKVSTETYAWHLPSIAVMAMQDDIGGVDSAHFLAWSKLFVEEVRSLTASGLKILLTFDGYRAHLSLPVMELFHANNIIVYALTVHKFGKTLPCDVDLYG